MTPTLVAPSERSGGRLAAGPRALVVVLLMVAACSDRPHRTPDQVPATYRDVSSSAGHRAHTGKVPCGDCHGDRGFAPPSTDLCARCHTVATPLHTGVPAPICQDCHAFGKDHRAPTACMRCHATPQGAVPTVGLHADQPCETCHRPHEFPSLQPQPCTKCHADRDTAHAGARGCVDCHRVHEPGAAADQNCARCHATQPAPLRIGDTARTAGHPACTGCHAPHRFGASEVKACTSCHRDQPVLAPAAHTQCTTCHSPHDDAPRLCTSCHAKPLGHPSTTTNPGPLSTRSNLPSLLSSMPFASSASAVDAGTTASPATTPRASNAACTGCHPPHRAGLAAKAVACASCHPSTRHATAPCLDCHVAHDGKPRPTAAMCATCHADRTRTTAATGHAACASCHTAHGARPSTSPALCATCHRDEASTAPRGHSACASCHTPHEPSKPPPACATCHADKAATPHGRALACATCHRPHGPAAPATPPRCESCHDRSALPGLHRVAQHETCATCHAPHEATPRSDRATCLSCHRDRQRHEPTAASCASCHPFRR